MRHRLLIGTALLATGIAVASCEKTPSGEPGAETQNQRGSEKSEDVTQGQQPAGQKQGTQQSEAQKPPDQSTQQPEAQKPPDRSGSRTARGENEQESKQAQHEAKQQNPQNGGGTAGRTVNLSREQIRQAQSVLKQKGFDVGGIDGILGPATRKALTAFQRQQGLQATGQMDERTVTALGIAGSTTTGGANTP